MNDREAITAAIADAGLDRDLVRTRDLSGGCIHRVCEAGLDDGGSIVAKLGSADAVGMFEEEAAGLRALAATETVVVPRPIAVGVYLDRAVLLMTALQPGRADDASWRRFGAALAELHAFDTGARYGFEIDNHLGTTFQPNTWCDDWVEFNARYRLGYQIELAREHGRLTDDEAQRLERLIDRLEKLIPRKPKPSLLHGDLWSGNAMPTGDDQGEPHVAVIDPAPSIGDGWADIAMMRLFGGFSPACFDAYADAVADHDRVEQRIAVYQLYHLLNHVNLFGRGYAGQAMAVAARLGC
jgi:protein-ribulosamine 3-kinase